MNWYIVGIVIFVLSLLVLALWFGGVFDQTSSPTDSTAPPTTLVYTVAGAPAETKKGWHALYVNRHPKVVHGAGHGCFNTATLEEAGNKCKTLANCNEFWRYGTPDIEARTCFMKSHDPKQGLKSIKAGQYYTFN
jgi:hypothetical protein